MATSPRAANCSGPSSARPWLTWRRRRPGRCSQPGCVALRSLAHQRRVGAGAQKRARRRPAGAGRVLSSRPGIDAAKQQLVVLGTEIAEARAAVAHAAADRRDRGAQSRLHRIRSPIDGIIGNRSAQVGTYVSGGTYLLSMVPVHGLWVDANFKEDDLGPHDARPAGDDRRRRAGRTCFPRPCASLAPATGAIFSVIPAENATGNFTKIVQRVPVRISWMPTARCSAAAPRALDHRERRYPRNRTAK